jgi:Tfp pilus assembly pilus retraction ATPase PilT
VGIAKVGSFRLSAFRSAAPSRAVFRCIPFVIPSLDTLGVPKMLGQLVLEKRGLILMVGATGTGKSTTLAVDAGAGATSCTGHILTIEDPIEFLFTNKKSVVNQREVGRDTESLQIALKNALRQAPDCILIGEIRDRETMSAALLRAVRPPGAGHAARQQQLPRAGAHPVVLHARGAPCAAVATWPPACAPSSRSACCGPAAAAFRRWRCCSTPSWWPS